MGFFRWQIAPDIGHHGSVYWSIQRSANGAISVCQLRFYAAQPLEREEIQQRELREGGRERNWVVRVAYAALESSNWAVEKTREGVVALLMASSVVATFATLGSINIPNPTDVQPQAFPTAGTHSSGRLTCGKSLVKLISGQDAMAVLLPLCAPGSNVSSGDSSTYSAATSVAGEQRRRRGRPKKIEETTSTSALRKKIEAKQVVDGVYTEECEGHSHEVEHHEGNPIGAHLFSYGEGPWDSALCLLDDLPQVFDSLTDQDVNISAESIKSRECLLVKASTRLAEKPYSTKLEWEKSCVFWADRIGLRLQMCRSSFEEINSKEAFVDEEDRITGALQIGVVGLRRPAPWICFGGGARPRRPRVWKTKVRRGTQVKSQKLVDLISTFSSSKEEVYGGLDAWCAWELEFPLVTVKKALKILQTEGQWKRVIQVTKWMLSKGQGKTMGTFQLLLQALDHEGRVEEADVVWEKLLTEYEDCTPRSMFACVLTMFERHNQPKRLLQVFADMEELEVKPDQVTVQRVARTYEKLGLPNRAKHVIAKYPPAKWVYKMHNGRRVRLKVYGHERDGSEKSGWITDDDNDEESDGDKELTLDEEIDENNRHDNVDTMTMSEQSPH